MKMTLHKKKKSKPNKTKYPYKQNTNKGNKDNYSKKHTPSRKQQEESLYKVLSPIISITYILAFLITVANMLSYIFSFDLHKNKGILITNGIFLLLCVIIFFIGTSFVFKWLDKVFFESLTLATLPLTIVMYLLVVMGIKFVVISVFGGSNIYVIILSIVTLFSIPPLHLTNKYLLVALSSSYEK